jgi:hypothetical protein
MFPGLSKLASFFGGLVTKITDFVGITNAAERALDAMTKTTKRANEALDQQIAVYEALGNKEEEVYRLKKQRVENELNVLREALRVKGKLSEEEQKQFRDLKLQSQILDIEETNRKKKVAEDEAKDNKAKNDKIAAQNKEKREKERQEQLDFEQQQRDDWEAAAQEEIRLDAERIAQEELNQSRADELKFGDLETSKQVTKELINLQHGLTEAQRAAADARRDIRFAELDLVAQFGGVLQELAGKNKALLAVGVIAENAAAIGKIVMNTQVANAKAAAQFPLTAGQPWVTINTISGALGVASSILAAKRALTNLGGGSVSGGMPSMNTKAPMTPTLSPTVQTNVQNAQAINQMSSQSTRAFVLNSDIQNEQQRNAYLQRNASI